VLDENRPKALPKPLGLLNGKRLLEGRQVDDPLLNEDLAEILMEYAGTGTNDLAATKENLPLTTAAVKGKQPRLATQADYLEDLAETQIFKISNKAHTVSFWSWGHGIKCR